MINQSPRPVASPTPVGLRDGTEALPRFLHRLARGRRAVLAAQGWAVLAGIPFLLSLPTRGETSPGEATVITHVNPAKPAGEAPEPQAQAAPSGGTPVHAARTFNDLILEAVEAMPAGGGYRANTVAVTALRSSVQMRNSQLMIEPNLATPSFCSGATYLVFLSVLNRLHREGRLQIDEPTLAALQVQEHQPDGVGVWGRWNANGPGTARLFYETGLGRNFTSFDEARPGDFLKIFWNDEIGSREFGHSVVYLGVDQRPEGEFVRYWSSNVPAGFGVREVPRQRIRRVLFSRLERPELIHRVSSIPARDAYLAAMLKRTSSEEEAAQMVGIKELPLARPAVAMGDPSSESVATSIPPKSAPATPAPSPAPCKGLLDKLFHVGHHEPAPSPAPPTGGQQ